MKKDESFRKWRDREGLTIEAFALQTKICYATVSKWYSLDDRKPRGWYRRQIRRYFPDCPLAAA